MRIQGAPEDQTPTYVGIDIGKTKTAAGIVSEYGALLSKREVPTDTDGGGAAIIDQTRQLIRQFQQEQQPPKFKGIGIGASGIVDPKRGLILSSGSIQNWSNIPIRAMFEQEFGVAVSVANDVHAAGLAEALFGAGRGETVSVFITISTGVGVCVVVDGRVWRGHHAMAGHIAHLPLFHSKGTTNDVFGGNGIAEAAERKLRKKLSTKDVFALADKGDPVASEIIDRAVQGASRVVAWLQNTVDPAIVIMGGSVALKEAQFVARIQRAAGESMDRYRTQLPAGPRIVLAELGVDAGVIGAAALCFHRDEGGQNP